MRRRTLRLDPLARVEGEGGLHVRIENGEAAEVRLRIFEPPRLFEALLRGRDFREAPDITARICGICPVAYQMSAVAAMEDALGVTVGGPLRALRRLLYCGEWIESHALHIHLLHAPDFLGYEDAMRMAADHPLVVRRGLELKKAGNAIVALLGGREIHPVNVRVGGFYRAPSPHDLRRLAGTLEEAREAARETVRWTAGLPIPDFQRDYEFIALRHPEEYPFCEGRLVSSRGLDIAVPEFLEQVVEEQVGHSTALHARLRQRGSYLVGPLARYNLNYDRLSPPAREAAQEAGLGPECRNPFQGIVVRSVEVLQACDEALRIIAAYDQPPSPAVKVVPRSGVGHGCTEAPRGILYHRYALDEGGKIAEARIVPPTSQNQGAIEEDVRRLVPQLLDLPPAELGWRCEQAVRNHDPCISCATHFLDLRLETR